MPGFDEDVDTVGGDAVGAFFIKWDDRKNAVPRLKSASIDGEAIEFDANNEATVEVVYGTSSVSLLAYTALLSTVKVNGTAVTVDAATANKYAKTVSVSDGDEITLSVVSENGENQIDYTITIEYGEAPVHYILNDTNVDDASKLGNISFAVSAQSGDPVYYFAKTFYSNEGPSARTGAAVYEAIEAGKGARWTLSPYDETENPTGYQPGTYDIYMQFMGYSGTGNKSWYTIAKEYTDDTNYTYYNHNRVVVTSSVTGDVQIQPANYQNMFYTAITAGGSITIPEADSGIADPQLIILARENARLAGIILVPKGTGAATARNIFEAETWHSAYTYHKGTYLNEIKFNDGVVGMGIPKSAYITPAPSAGAGSQSTITEFSAISGYEFSPALSTSVSEYNTVVPTLTSYKLLTLEDGKSAGTIGGTISMLTFTDEGRRDAEVNTTSSFSGEDTTSYKTFRQVNALWFTTDMNSISGTDEFGNAYSAGRSTTNAAKAYNYGWEWVFNDEDEEKSITLEDGSYNLYIKARAGTVNGDQAKAIYPVVSDSETAAGTAGNVTITASAEEGAATSKYKVMEMYLPSRRSSYARPPQDITWVSFRSIGKVVISDGGKAKVRITNRDGACLEKILLVKDDDDVVYSSLVSGYGANAYIPYGGASYEAIRNAEIAEGQLQVASVTNGDNNITLYWDPALAGQSINTSYTADQRAQVTNTSLAVDSTMFYPALNTAVSEYSAYTRPRPTSIKYGLKTSGADTSVTGFSATSDGARYTTTGLTRGSEYTVEAVVPEGVTLKAGLLGSELETVEGNTFTADFVAKGASISYVFELTSGGVTNRYTARFEVAAPTISTYEFNVSQADSTKTIEESGKIWLKNVPFNFSDPVTVSRTNFRNVLAGDEIKNSYQLLYGGSQGRDSGRYSNYYVRPSTVEADSDDNWMFRFTAPADGTIYILASTNTAHASLTLPRFGYTIVNGGHYPVIGAMTVSNATTLMSVPYTKQITQVYEQSANENLYLTYFAESQAATDGYHIAAMAAEYEAGTKVNNSLVYLTPPSGNDARAAYGYSSASYPTVRGFTVAYKKVFSEGDTVVIPYQDIDSGFENVHYYVNWDAISNDTSAAVSVNGSELEVSEDTYQFNAPSASAYTFTITPTDARATSDKYSVTLSAGESTTFTVTADDLTTTKTYTISSVLDAPILTGLTYSEYGSGVNTNVTGYTANDESYRGTTNVTRGTTYTVTATAVAGKTLKVSELGGSFETVAGNEVTKTFSATGSSKTYIFEVSDENRTNRYTVRFEIPAPTLTLDDNFFINPLVDELFEQAGKEASVAAIGHGFNLVNTPVSYSNAVYFDRSGWTPRAFGEEMLKNYVLVQSTARTGKTASATHVDGSGSYDSKKNEHYSIIEANAQSIADGGEGVTRGGDNDWMYKFTAPADGILYVAAMNTSWFDAPTMAAYGFTLIDAGTAYGSNGSAYDSEVYDFIPTSGSNANFGYASHVSQNFYGNIITHYESGARDGEGNLLYTDKPVFVNNSGIYGYRYIYKNVFEAGDEVKVPFLTTNSQNAPIHFVNWDEREKVSLSVAIEGEGSVTGSDSADYTATTRDYSVGKEFTLTAAPDAGYEFKYWIDTDSSRIISEEATYSFTLASAKSIKAKFASTEDTTKTVVFKNKNGKIVLYTISSEGSITAPSATYMGYTFQNWTKDGVTDWLADETRAYADVDAGTYDAKYIKNADTYTVTVTGGTIKSTGLTTGSYEYDTSVTVTPNDAGSFKYWTKNGQIVSYDADYSFFVSAETINVVAVTDGDSTARPIISLTSTSLGLVSGKTKYALFSERNINGAGTFVESGIVIGDSEAVSVDDYDNRGISTSKSGKGQFTVRKSVAEGQTCYAKAYMIYKDSAGALQYVYSNCVELTYSAE